MFSVDKVILMKRRIVKNNRKGLTLIEVLVTLAVLSILLPVAFSFLGFNLKVFNTSDSLSQVQFDVRMTSDFITTQIRNVRGISFHEGDLTDAESISIHDIKAKYPLIDSVQMRVSKEESSSLLDYIIIGKDSRGGNQYKLESKVLLNNNPEYIVNEVDGQVYYDTVYFSK